MSPVRVSSKQFPVDRRGRRGPFQWSCEADAPDSLRLRLLGELDLDGIEELRVALSAAEDPVHLTVDLAGLDFIDCAATACMFGVAIKLSRSGRKVLLVGDRGQVARLLDLTGLPAGVEPLSDGPHLSLVSGPWARAGRGVGQAPGDA